MMDIYALVNGYIDHIPPVLFHYDITFGPKRDMAEDFNTRVSNALAGSNHYVGELKETMLNCFPPWCLFR